MTRTVHQFHCEGEQLVGSLDSGSSKTGLLIVSGGNEIRSGAHAGMSKLAHSVAKEGFPVFRYDRRGIGDSTGSNQEFLSSEQDIKSAMLQFQALCPDLNKIVAFGNCDAASALAYFDQTTDMNAYILANPWVIESAPSEPTEPTTPNAAAIRSRYWERIKNPRSIVDLLTGKISISKLLKGLMRASQKQENSELAIRLRSSLAATNNQINILVANRDTTALAFMASWKSTDFADVRDRSNITLSELDSASHSFADERSKKWLRDQILKSLRSH